jgi:hypothetical protein
MRKGTFAICLLLIVHANVLAQKPTIQSIQPTSGPIGTIITIAGTNFSSMSTENIVYFGPVKAQVLSSSSSSLQVLVPSGASYDYPSVIVNGNSAQSLRPFIVTFQGAGGITTNSFTQHDFNVQQREASTVAGGDFDLNGKIDLLVSNWDGEVAVLRNNSEIGSPVFTQAFSLSAQRGAGDICVADIDLDGHLDVLVGNYSAATISVFRNTSASLAISFASPVILNAGPSLERVLVVDINDDGKPDLIALASDARAFYVYRNTSVMGVIDNSSFSPPVSFETQSNPHDIAVGDVDGDYKRDVVVTNWGSRTVSVFRNTSTVGTINAQSFATAFSYSTEAEPTGVSLADLDQDGKLDFVATLRNGTVAAYRNQSTPGPLSGGSFALPVSFHSGEYPRFISMADFDGDGKLDMSVPYQGYTNPHPGLSIYRNEGTPGEISTSTFPSEVAFATDFYPYKIAIADFDGDGKPDIAAPITTQHKVTVLLNRAPSVHFLTVISENCVVTKTPDMLAYSQGIVVQLSASPNSGYQFDFWTGDVPLGQESENPLQITKDRTRTLTAHVAPLPGTIQGTILSGNNGVSNVVVKLLDQGGALLEERFSGASGEYSFSNIPSALQYQVMIVDPLGYSVDMNPKAVTLSAGGTMTANFLLTRAILTNNARGLGYWKHQFDVYLKGRGNAQESREQMNSYIETVHRVYTNHFNIFEGLFSFADWAGVLTRANGASMREIVKQHLAACVLNFASLKIGQYMVVTADERTAGDALTYVSMIISNSISTNEELERAKDITERLNNKVLITAGWISAGGGVVYKSSGGDIAWVFGNPTEFLLRQNYPNPFNPTTTIEYQLPSRGTVQINIYNSLGQLVRSLVNEQRDAGTHSVVWDGRDNGGNAVATGAYFYQLRVNGLAQSKRMLLLK